MDGCSRFAAAVALLLAFSTPSHAGDAAHGNEIFENQCARCHAISPSEPGKRGPYLAGLFARAPGSVKGFPYRMVFTEAGPVWTEDGLDRYLLIHLLPEAGDRSDVIAFLKQVTASSPPTSSPSK